MKLVKFFGQVESLIGQVNVNSCLPEGTNGKKKVTSNPATYHRAPDKTWCPEQCRNRGIINV